MTRQTRRWILIADVAMARVVEVQEPDKELHTLANLVFRNNAACARQLISDRPDRMDDIRGEGYHAMIRPSDSMLEKRFAQTVLDEIASHIDDDAFDRFIVVASPEMLSHLRCTMPSVLLERLEQEVARDLTDVPANALPAVLGETLASVH